MAVDKKSFVLYCDLIHTIKKLPNDVAGEVFKHILEYVNDNDPETENILVDVVFEPIKQHLKRDLVKYQSKKEQWSEAGKKSAEKRALKKAEQNPTVSTDVESRSTVPTVNDNDNDNVNDNANDILKRKETFSFALNQIDNLKKETIEAFLNYWTEPNKLGTKMRFEMEKTWSLSGRLATWTKNEKKFDNGKSTKPNLEDKLREF